MASSTVRVWTWGVATLCTSTTGSAASTTTTSSMPATFITALTGAVNWAVTSIPGRFTVTKPLSTKVTP